MKNSNSPKNRHAADNIDRKKDEEIRSGTTQKNEREMDDNDKEQVSAQTFNRGYYSRNGGDKGYRGL